MYETADNTPIPEEPPILTEPVIPLIGTAIEYNPITGMFDSSLDGIWRGNATSYQGARASLRQGIPRWEDDD